MANEPLVDAPETASSTALVSLDGGRRQEDGFRTGTQRPLAHFVTQLIACERRLAAYRSRRQAEPADASERYGRAGTTAATGGRRFEKTV